MIGLINSGKLIKEIKGVRDITNLIANKLI